MLRAPCIRIEGRGTPRAQHECLKRVEAIDLTCGTIFFYAAVICYTFIGHAGDTTSISPVLCFFGVDQQRLASSDFWNTVERSTPHTTYWELHVKRVDVISGISLTRAPA